MTTSERQMFDHYLAQLRELDREHSGLIKRVLDVAVRRNKGIWEKSVGLVELTIIGFVNRSSDVLDAISTLMTRRNVFIVEAVFRLQLDSVLYLNYILSLKHREAEEAFCRNLVSKPRRASVKDENGRRLPTSD